MGRNAKCTRDDILTILEMIDSGNWTQKEIARKYDVTPATISNYNRLHRARFKNENYARIIAKQNKELLSLKKRFNLDTTEEEKVPAGFCTAALCLTGPNGYLTDDGDAIYGFFTKSRLDAKKFVERHPEYYFYTIVGDKNDANIPAYLKTESFVRRYGFFLSRSNMGHISEKFKLQIIEYEFGEPAK